MAKRHFLKLCQTYNPKKISPAGWFLSSKLDGVRAFWDSGITRGWPVTAVPFANVEKNDRYKETQYSTGLWSRYGHPIHAPDWWLNKLPQIMLDGELYSGLNSFQRTVSVTKKLIPVDGEWATVQYVVFDSPRVEEIFADGTLNETNYKKIFRGILDSGIKFPEHQAPTGGFTSRYKWLQTNAKDFVHPQKQLPFKTADALIEIENSLDSIINQGGEGVILVAPNHLWEPIRSWTCLKHKAVNDAEGTVTGYIAGRETDKGSKLLGLMGALILQQDNGKRLELSGFTDEERKLSDSEWAILHPGEEVPIEITSPHFPRGSRITYKYRELTNDGISKEARYFRKTVD